METENKQETVTTTENVGTETPANTPAENPQKTGAENPPFKTFATQEEFDNHSAGIRNNAQKKVEKELLAILGLRPDEKDKLAKFKEAYDATLTDAERKAKELESLTADNASLKSSLAEKEAIISVISKSTGKNANDIVKFVKMAKGLVDENTTIEQALEQVFALSNMNSDKFQVPYGTPPRESSTSPEINPFKTGNLTEQGKIFKADPNKARELYKIATGKNAPW